MAQSIANILMHSVFSTKNRQPFLSNDALRKGVFAYLAGICRNLHCDALDINGMPDHIHIVHRLSRHLSPAGFIREVKKASTGWIRPRGGICRKFSWQGGYSMFSVSQSNLEVVRAYVRLQEHHHRRMSFQDELRSLLRKHGMEFDEQYLWD